MKNNMDGANSWSSLAQLFNALNTTNYVILRNYEFLPNNFNPSIHGDVDILVENLEKVILITHAKKEQPESPNNVAFIIKVGDEEIKFDMRYVGDGYYDEKWERDMLLNAREITSVSKDTIKVMSTMHQYFSLLYHVYLQKKEVASDYPQKLRQFAIDAGLEYKNDTRYLMLQLKDFMRKNHYHVSIPSDEGVEINWKNLRYLSEYSKTKLIYLRQGGIKRFMQRVMRKIIKLNELY